MEKRKARRQAYRQTRKSKEKGLDNAKSNVVGKSSIVDVESSLLSDGDQPEGIKTSMDIVEKEKGDSNDTSKLKEMEIDTRASISSNSSSSWVDTDPYRVKVQSCTAKKHIYKDNCAYNPNCLYGLGAQKKGIWMATPDVIKKLGEDGQKVEQDYFRDPKKTPCGLENLGATCYVNALIQCLFMNVHFRKAVYEAAGPLNEINSADKAILRELQLVFARMQLSMEKSISLNKLASLLGLQTGIQQDATEFTKLFLTFLENVVETVKSENNKNKYYSDVPDLVQMFQGQQRNITKCMSCKKESGTLTPYTELSLQIKNPAPISINVVEDNEKKSNNNVNNEKKSGNLSSFFVKNNLRASIYQYGAVEELRDSNKYNCERCGGLKNAQRFCRVEKIPLVLNIQLMRFVYDMKTFSRRKLKDSFEIPKVIDFTEIGSSLLQGEALKNVEEMGSLRYRLIAVLHHKGATAHAGHYTADVYDFQKQCWWAFDDEKVEQISTPCQKEEVDTSISAKANPKPKKSKKKKTGEMNTNTNKNVTQVGSRTAYMIVYVREDMVDSAHGDEIQVPPWLRKVVSQENELAEQKLKGYSKNLERVNLEIDKRKKIYTDLFVNCKPYISCTPKERHLVCESSKGPAANDVNDHEAFWIPTNWLRELICGPDFTVNEEITNVIPDVEGDSPTTDNVTKENENGTVNGSKEEKTVQENMENKGENVTKNKSKKRPQLSQPRLERNVRRPLRKVRKLFEDEKATEKKIQEILKLDKEEARKKGTNGDFIEISDEENIQQDVNPDAVNTSLEVREKVKEEEVEVHKSLDEVENIKERSKLTLKKVLKLLFIKPIRLKQYVCPHGNGKIAPETVSKLKRINARTWYELIKLSGEPDITLSSLQNGGVDCAQCIQELKHRESKKRLEEEVWSTVNDILILSNQKYAEDKNSALISRKWVTNWKALFKQHETRRKNEKQRSHTPNTKLKPKVGEGSMENINDDIICSHGNLRPGKQGKRWIPLDHWNYIRENALGGKCKNSRTFKFGSVVCQACERELSHAKELAKIHRETRDEQLKSKEYGSTIRKLMKRVCGHPDISYDTNRLKAGIYFVVPRSWMFAWRIFMNGDVLGHVNAPNSIEKHVNEMLLCPHNRVQVYPRLLRWLQDDTRRVRLLENADCIEKGFNDDECEILSEREWIAMNHFYAGKSFTELETNRNCKDESTSAGIYFLLHNDGDDNIDIDAPKAKNDNMFSIQFHPELCIDCMAKRREKHIQEKKNYRDKIFDVIRVTSGVTAEMSNGSRRSNRQKGGQNNKQRFTITASSDDTIEFVRLKIFQALVGFDEKRRKTGEDMELSPGSIRILKEESYVPLNGQTLMIQNDILLGDIIYFDTNGASANGTNISTTNENMSIEELTAFASSQNTQEIGFSGTALRGR